jgi:DnaD/phage-associated family protein
MRYIEKTAFTWEREGVVTLEAAERYIKKLETKRSLVGEIKAILQIRDRELLSEERRYIDGWLTGGFSAEVIELAYERTVMGTGGLTWKYMDSILNSWRQKGLRTVREIEAKDKKSAAVSERRSRTAAKPSAPSPSDIEHMKKFLEKLREE